VTTPSSTGCWGSGNADGPSGDVRRHLNPLQSAEIPHKDQDYATVVADFRTHRESVDFILPVTAVIETGNHIAQIKDGNQRRACATKFAAIVQAIVDRTAPWTLDNVEMERYASRTTGIRARLWTMDKQLASYSP
jgi:hypothetical protein